MKTKSILVLLTAFFGFVPHSFAETVHLRWATPHEPNHVVLTGAKKFKEIIEKESNGQIVVDILSFKQIENIAADRTTGTVTAEAVISEMQKGKFDVSQIYISDISARYPQLNALRLPYLIKSHDHMSKVVESPIGSQLMAHVNTMNVKGLGIGYSGGQEILASTGKTPRKPKEFSGVTVRPTGGYQTIESETFALMGAKPVHDAGSATKDYTALPKEYPLQLPVYQKMLEGQSDMYGAILTDLFVNDQLEPQFAQKVKAVLVPGMFYYTSIMVIDQKTFDKFDAKQQKLILRAGKEAAKYERDYVVKLESKMLKQIQAAQMQVVEYSAGDRAEFEKFLQPIYEKHKFEVGESVIEAIKKLAPMKDRKLSSSH